MKKLLNPKLAEKKVTVIEYSSSQEKLEDSEDDNKEVMKGKKKYCQKKNQYSSLILRSQTFSWRLEIR